jgi:hypothetical protein
METGRADAPGGAGASRDGWSGVRTGSATGREGEPIDDGSMIVPGASQEQGRSDPRLGPFVLGRVPRWRALAALDPPQRPHP